MPGSYQYSPECHLDFMAGFDWLDMSWVYLVLAKKGVGSDVIDRLQRLYTVSTTVVVIK